MWYSGIVIPSQASASALARVPHGHLGLVHMKAIIRSYLWFLGLDKAIKHQIKNANQ